MQVNLLSYFDVVICCSHCLSSLSSLSCHHVDCCVFLYRCAVPPCCAVPSCCTVVPCCLVKHMSMCHAFVWFVVVVMLIDVFYIVTPPVSLLLCCCCHPIAIVMLIVVFVHCPQSCYPCTSLLNLLLIVICLLSTFLVVHFVPVLILVPWPTDWPTPNNRRTLNNQSATNWQTNWPIDTKKPTDIDTK